MAGELFTTYEVAGTDVYAIIRRLSDFYVWDTTTSAFVVWADGDVADYDVDLTDVGGDLYKGDFPSSIAAGDYRIFYYERAGGVPALTDTFIESIDRHWNGAALVDTSVVTLSPYALTTVVKVKRLLHLAASTDDDLLTELINAATFKIEKHCNRQFLARAYTERTNGYGTKKLVTKHYPITELTAIYAVSGAGSEEETELIDSTTYRYDANTGIIRLIADVWTQAWETAFASGFLNFEIQYTAGYATIPDDLDMVCREVVRDAYNLSKRDPTLKSESLGDYSYSLASQVELNDGQRERLAPYVSVAIGGKM
jgi:uncharacterized phiE125 gp8 family phage protein